jgi:hypothetical protein
VISWFQTFAFKCNVYRYTSAGSSPGAGNSPRHSSSSAAAAAAAAAAPQPQPRTSTGKSTSPALGGGGGMTHGKWRAAIANVVDGNNAALGKAPGWGCTS